MYLQSDFASIARVFSCGGEGGIRTPGTLLEYTRFPVVHLQPLGHLSDSASTSTRAGECFDASIVPLDFLQIGELVRIIFIVSLGVFYFSSVSTHLTFIHKQDITLKM